MKINLKNAQLIKISALAVILTLIIIFIIYPIIKDIIAINQEINQERLDLEKKLSRGLNLKEIKKNLDEIEESIYQLDLIFIPENKILEFITELEYIATKNNISIDIDSKFEGTVTAGIQNTPTQINIEGNYIDLMTFIRDVESLNYYYNIDMIIISTRQKAGDYEITMQIIGQTYLKKN